MTLSLGFWGRQCPTLVLFVLNLLLPCVQSQVVQWDIKRQDIDTRLRRRADNTYEEVIMNEKGSGGYFASVRIGTPGQNVTLQLDTASSDIWIPYVDASVCRSSTFSRDAGCDLGAYDPDNSTTFKEYGPDSFEIAYADQSYVKGEYFFDVFEMGGARLKNFTMAVGLQTDIPYGILGVGYAINEASITSAGFMYPNLPIAMQEGGLINTIAYSLWLNDLGASTGNILFGGVDTAKFLGDLMRLKVLKDSKVDNYTQFIIPMTSMEATSPSGTDILTTTKWPLEVILDSGSTLTYLPNDMVQSIWDEVGATYNSNLDMAVLPCSHAYHAGYFSFGFGGTGGPRINITMDELVVDLTDGHAPEFTTGEYTGERVCQFGIQRSSSSPYTLGDTFLRSAYVVYDLVNNEIGIAATDFNSTKTNIVAFESDGAYIPSATAAPSQRKSMDYPQPTTTGLSAAAGFQDLASCGQNGVKCNDTEDAGTSDDEDIASLPRAFSSSGLLVMGMALGFAAFGTLTV